MGDQIPTLNVDSHRDEYLSFIARLRQAFGEAGSFIHNRPVLRAQAPPQGPDDWIDIVLRTDTQRLRLRLRRDNLYLDGFRNDEEGSQWFEIGVEAQGRQHLIPGSTFVGFEGSYAAMERAGGVGDQTRLAVALGQTPLSNAVRQLSTLTDPTPPGNRTSTAYSLLVTIQMICEAIRLQWISDYLAENWNASINTPTQMIDLETSWGTLSDALIHAEQDPAPSNFRLPRPNDLGITNAAGAAAVLGILLHRTIRGSRVIRAIMDIPWGDYPRGRTLLEVFWVRIERIDDENPGDLYGTIKAFDGLGSQDLYNRSRDDYESIHPGDSATLTGPSRSVLATDGFVLDFQLWDKDVDLSPDDSIVYEKITWSPFELGNTFDATITQRVAGTYGSATVHYAVLSNAAQALVEIVLINGDNEDPANVFGTITAHNGLSDIALFRKDSKHYIGMCFISFIFSLQENFKGRLLLREYMLPFIHLRLSNTTTRIMLLTLESHRCKTKCRHSPA